MYQKSERQKTKLAEDPSTVKRNLPKNLKTVEFNEQIEIKKAKEKKAKTSQTEVDDKIKYEVNEEEFFYNDVSS